MSETSRRLFLLGPQPDYASLRTVLSRIDLRAPLGIITAGWETDEQHDEELRAAIGGPCVNLNLFARTEQLFVDDPDLIAGLRDRQDELRHLRDVYNARLGDQLRAARRLLRREERLVDLDTERESAIEMVRQLDRQYFVRTSQVIDRYEDTLQTASRPLVASHRREVAEILNGVDAVLIAGGHVGIILNRLKLFGVLDHPRQIPLIAWSGGAMALAQQVVFYHDSPPQGRGNPEVLRAGMGLFHDVLPLPAGRDRLTLEDRIRVTLFARRFKTFDCVLFDQETILERREGIWSSLEQSAWQLGTDGNVVEFVQ